MYTRFGKMPLFSMQTSSELRAEGHRVNLERLMSDIRSTAPTFTPNAWAERMLRERPHPPEERRQLRQQSSRDGETGETEFK